MLKQSVARLCSYSIAVERSNVCVPFSFPFNLLKCDIVDIYDRDNKPMIYHGRIFPLKVSLCLPMSSTSHNDHDNFDPDNTLSTSVRYDFMDRVSDLNSSLNRPQSSRTEILIVLIIMPNTIPKEHAAHFRGCVVPFLTCVQCRDTTVPVPLDILSLI